MTTAEAMLKQHPFHLASGPHIVLSEEDANKLFQHLQTIQDELEAVKRKTCPVRCEEEHDKQFDRLRDRAIAAEAALVSLTPGGSEYVGDPELQSLRQQLAEVQGREEYCRPEVRWFARKMEERLRANDHKGGWNNCDTEWLLGRLNEEVEELESEFDRKERSGHAILRPESIAREAADVANFAMMIADNNRCDALHNTTASPVMDVVRAAEKVFDWLQSNGLGLTSPCQLLGEALWKLKE